MEDDYALGMLIKGRTYISQGKVEEGLEILKKASEIDRGWKYIGYGPALIEAGKIKEGIAVLNELESLPLNGFRALLLAVMYVELGDYDRALEYLNYEQKHGWFPWIRIFFADDEFGKDPRYLKIIRDMNLPDPAPLVYEPEA
jgi:tetratricopeptide (TPR) repeat protein